MKSKSPHQMTRSGSFSLSSSPTCSSLMTMPSLQQGKTFLPQSFITLSLFLKHSFPLSCFLISLGLLVRCHPPREPCRALLCSIIPLFLWPSLIFLQRIYHYLGLYLFVYLFIFLSRVKFYKGSFVLFTTVWLILAHHHYYNC